MNIRDNIDIMVITVFIISIILRMLGYLDGNNLSTILTAIVVWTMRRPIKKSAKYVRKNI